ncbi:MULTISPECIES: hypothetical protein [unclassified Streptomyces]|uniref:hypothetical protein n=1 Tax=unclassified Streptomyces TaxID=2593676 RepID=UPI002E180454|nr:MULTISPECIES: hypothetical protein [unclassified Streptomyces]
MTHLAYGSSGLVGRLIDAVVPEWAELPLLILIFVGLFGMIVYGRYKARRDGAASPANRPENIAIRKGASLMMVVSSALLEILGVMGFFAFGWPWWIGVAPLVLCVLGVFMVRSAFRAGEQHQ